jgi:NAD(P)H-flavin reductase
MPQRIQCNVVDVIPHGDRVYSVLLRPAMRAPRFLPGQFLHLALDGYKAGDFWPDSRVFSIASPPSDRELLRLTYAVKGAYTTRMETELHAGREVWIKLPYGEFLVDREKDVCLLAGGTGITAFTAFLGELPTDQPHQVQLFYGARRKELLIYRSLAEDTALRCGNAQVHLLSEQAEVADDRLLCGRIETELIWRLIDEPQKFTYYIAGPPEMIRTLTRDLRLRGTKACQIVIDAWE